MICIDVIPVQCQNFKDIKSQYEIKTIAKRDFYELMTKVSLNCFLPGIILSHIKH